MYASHKTVTTALPPDRPLGCLRDHGASAARGERTGGTFNRRGCTRMKSPAGFDNF
jgi:hypothetical protein